MATTASTSEIKVLRMERFPASFQPNWKMAPEMGTKVVDERSNKSGPTKVYVVWDGKRQWLVLRDG